ncbi:MAG: PQQ-dependent sugar dehydrogenase [Planctomycetota bacterium]|jgi:glucose/arabinose dehydrogenase
MNRALLAAALSITCLVAFAALAEEREPKLPLERIELPEGFKIELFAGDLPGARSLRRGEKGTIFVSTRMEGVVYAVRDEDGDGRAEKTLTVLDGLDTPNGIALRKGSLYVAEMHRVVRYDEIEDRLSKPPEPVLVNDSLPYEEAHGWRYIGFGPDDLLYVPVAYPGDIGISKDERISTIMRMKPDGTGLELFARGIRHTVGFDWHPDTKVMWFTENGWDFMGDDLPPDELNRAPKKGLHFGFPHWHGRDVRDPKFHGSMKKGEFVPPARDLPAHVAPLGMRFYTGTMFPEKYRKQIFIAEHGSWNRAEPVGYRVTVVRLEGTEAVGYEAFAEGWLSGGKAWGRPVDVLVMPDGALLVSDDRAGAVYRITYATK